MDRYARGQQLREEVRLGLRPSRAGKVWRTIGAVAVAAAVAKNGGTIVVVPYSAPPQNQEAEDLRIAARPRPAAPPELNGILSVPEVVERTKNAVVVLETGGAFAGSSGGPVVNMHGRVLGVNTLQLIDGQNLNFAVDVTHVIELVRAMIRQREGEVASASAER